jgi:hypothetical protein
MIISESNRTVSIYPEARSYHFIAALFAQILNEGLSVFSNAGDKTLFLFFFSELLLGSGSNILF